MAEDAASTTDLFEIIRTTRSMRRLKQEPVPDALIRKVIEAGVCAPSQFAASLSPMSSSRTGGARHSEICSGGKLGAVATALVAL
jgi:nitroreductase